MIIKNHLKILSLKIKKILIKNFKANFLNVFFIKKIKYQYYNNTEDYRDVHGN